MSNQKFWRKKLWRITIDSPNLPKFFTTKVFFRTVYVTALLEYFDLLMHTLVIPYSTAEESMQAYYCPVAAPFCIFTEYLYYQIISILMLQL